MWNKLSMTDKATIIREAARNGITNLAEIQDIYNSYANGGPKKGPTYNKSKRRWYNSKGQQLRLGDRYYHEDNNGGHYIQYNSDGTTTRFTPVEAVARLYKNTEGRDLAYRESIKAPLYGRNIKGTQVMNDEELAKSLPYYGGTANEVRQGFFDRHREFTDSVISISKRYGLNPNLVASRIAKEGPVDKLIKSTNNYKLGIRQGKDLTDIPIPRYYKYMDTNGATWGLDDTGDNILKGKVKITTTAPYEWYDEDFENEHERLTRTVYSPQWWFGIEATAAELKARRDNLKKDFPNATSEWLDAAAAGAFNYGETGIRKNLNIVPEFAPFIKLK